jgi:hypothetical protein
MKRFSRPILTTYAVAALALVGLGLNLTSGSGAAAKPLEERRATLEKELVEAAEALQAQPTDAARGERLSRLAEEIKYVAAQQDAVLQEERELKRGIKEAETIGGISPLGKIYGELYLHQQGH